MKRTLPILRYMHVLTFCIIFVSCHQDKRIIQRNTKVWNLVGKQFAQPVVQDSTGNNQMIDFTKAKLTIVDFWFSTCPPCITELEQFGDLLQKGSGDVQIVSISVNAFHIWKSTLTSGDSTWAFFKKSNPAWINYCLRSNEDPRLKNDIPADNFNTMDQYDKRHAFPLALVVDASGKVIDAPVSAAAYLDSVVQKH